LSKWLIAECPQCGPFWAQETLERKIERCSKCSGPLSGPPTNLAYSEDELDEQESISDEYTDFERNCRRELTGSKEIRRPTPDEISDHADYATLEVLSMHDHIKSIFDHYHKQKVLPFNRKKDPDDKAWREFWNKEYEKSLQRMVDLRSHLEGVYDILEASGYCDDMIRRDMDDLWTHEWFHNREQVEKKAKKK
jgi:hypothetical protein